MQTLGERWSIVEENAVKLCSLFRPKAADRHRCPWWRGLNPNSDVGSRQRNHASGYALRRFSIQFRERVTEAAQEKRTVDHHRGRHEWHQTKLSPGAALS